jgi:tetratricopeptide (TPR) repeat protein
VFIIRNMSESANSYSGRLPVARVHVWLLILPALVLAGCAGNGGAAGGKASSPVEHQLMAEIALQRGQYVVAVQEYLSLAQQSANPDHARRATELALDYGFIAYALAAAERWVELRPDSAVAHAYLGRINVRRNLPEQAFASLDLSLGPVEERTDRDYLMLSSELGIQNSPSRSLKVFERFNEAYPGTPGISASVASLASRSGDTGLAVSAARETLQLAPDWMIARVWLARFLLAAGDSASAFEQMAFALEMTPGLEMELEFVQLLALADEQQDAAERLARLFVRYPGEPELVRVRGALALKWQDYETAIADFTYLLSEAYYVSESFWHLGQVAYEQEKYLQAIRYFQRVGEGPWQVPAVHATSRSYLALGDGNTALAVQREFVSEHPKGTVPELLTRAEILAGMGRFNEALETTDVALEFNPWDEELWLYRGGLFEKIGQLDDSVESFRRAEELAPDSALVLNALGYTLTIASDDYDEAYEYITRALELQPENPAIMDSMGWVLYRQGDQAAARGWLEQAYALLPDPEVAAHLGEVMWVQGERDAATELWADALRNYPESSVLNETTSRFLQ